MSFTARHDGSSPRVRGTHDEDNGWAGINRFIPACAGNASGRNVGRRRRPVHPRVCGERQDKMIADAGPAGSSPRVRGTHDEDNGWAGINRFIPACAGNAPGVNQYLNQKAVHPRVCGERVNAVVSAPDEAGSSPRVRGTRGQSGGVLNNRRFIPACAGNAWATSRAAEPPSVHPRVCGERTSCRELYPIDFHLVKNLTDGIASDSRLAGATATVTKKAQATQPARPSLAGLARGQGSEAVRQPRARS